MVIIIIGLCLFFMLARLRRFVKWFNLPEHEIILTRLHILYVPSHLNHAFLHASLSTLFTTINFDISTQSSSALVFICSNYLSHFHLEKSVTNSYTIFQSETTPSSGRLLLCRRLSSVPYDTTMAGDPPWSLKPNRQCSCTIRAAKQHTRCHSIVR